MEIVTLIFSEYPEKRQLFKNYLARGFELAYVNIFNKNGVVHIQSTIDAPWSRWSAREQRVFNNADAEVRAWRI